MTTSGIKQWVEQFVSEDTQPTVTHKRFYVMSSAHFHGLWEVLLRFAYETHEVKQDFADALLEEGFYLGYDYGDDWLPILNHITPAVILDWRLHRRDGLIIASYTPAKLWPLLLEGKSMGYTIHETSADREGEVVVLNALSKQIGRTVYQMGKLSRWDGYLPRLDVYDHKPEMIFEIKRRAYDWTFFEREGLILTRKKFEGLVQHYKSGVDPILVVEAQSEIRWVNVAQITPDKIRYDKAKCDRVDVPYMEDVVIIHGSVFKNLNLLKGMD